MYLLSATDYWDNNYVASRDFHFNTLHTLARVSYTNTSTQYSLKGQIKVILFQPKAWNNTRHSFGWPVDFECFFNG